MKKYFIPIKRLENIPYSSILGYPKPTKRQIAIRIKELDKIGIKAVSFTGPTTVNNLEILGKGYVGIVVLAKKGTKQVALKIRRTDSPRNNMQNESKLLRLANSAGVGPSLIDHSKNFVVMGYLDGEKIGSWIKNLKGKGSSKKVKTIIKDILEGCFRLDQIGLDHGELSNITKHIIVDKMKPTMIDFESSSVNRRVSNVTSATQAIYIGTGIAKSVNKIYKIPKREAIIDVLRNYKREQSRQSFEELLRVLRL